MPTNSIRKHKKALRHKDSLISLVLGHLVGCLGAHYPRVITSDKVSDILK